MKIGIVTFQRADNYGALLQCYALYTTIKKFDVDVEVVDYRNSIIENRYKSIPRLRKNIFSWLSDVIQGIPYMKERVKRKKAFDSLRNLICFSKPYTKKELLSKELDYELLISGSDQVLNPAITAGFDDIYYLNIPGAYTKATYAASIGNIAALEEQKVEFEKRMKQLNHISLREEDACIFLNAKMGIPVQQSIDPTLLLSKEEWENLVKDVKLSEKIPSKYVLLYFVQDNPEILKIAEKISKDKGIPIVCFSEKVAKNKNIIFYGDAGPLEFVKLIYNAECVVTSSFHATVFSSIFSKDVYVLTHSVTGARVISLAKIFGISGRVFSCYEGFEQIYENNCEISYDYSGYVKQLDASIAYIKSLVDC